MDSRYKELGAHCSRRIALYIQAKLHLLQFYNGDTQMERPNESYLTDSPKSFYPYPYLSNTQFIFYALGDKSNVRNRKQCGKFRLVYPTLFAFSSRWIVWQLHAPYLHLPPCIRTTFTHIIKTASINNILTYMCKWEYTRPKWNVGDVI